jgi:acido-empty-quinoprotein group A
MIVARAVATFVAGGAALVAHAVTTTGAPAPPRELAWPTYNGDYSGRRFSTAAQVNSANVNRLSLAWTYKVFVGLNPGLFGKLIKSTPVVLNGVMYFTVPDHCWAIDAATGKELWHFKWQSQGGIHVGNRGVGIYKNWVYFETPDNHLISLDAETGRLRWAVEVADTKQQYFSTSAPLVIGDHVLVGVGGDSFDVAGFLESRDPTTGAVQWRWNSEPKSGEPGSETWPNAESMAHGGGMTWLPGTYDPELNLIYWGTGNPNPVHAGKGRAGNNLWTCSIVALDVDSGRMRWWFQVSPHDTHDWDAVQTPVLIDDVLDGKPRKLLAQASRNGYFFLLDRVTGKNIVSSRFVELNWSKGLNARGEPIPDVAKEPKSDGVLVSPRSNGATNWPSPTFDPETGLFYVSAAESYSVFYLTDTGEHAEGYAGLDKEVWARAMIRAIDYKTGNFAWTHTFPSHGAMASGLLSTSGKLLFSGDQSNNFIAFDPRNGNILWHYRMHAGTTNGPITYELNGEQFVVVAGADTLYAFALKR